MSRSYKTQPGTHMAITQGLNTNDILFKLTNAHYRNITDTNSRYHSLKPDKKSSYLTIFACQFGRYRFTRLLFRVELAVNMFQQRIDKLFKDLPNVYAIADNILIVGYSADRRDNDKILIQVMQIYHQENVKLHKINVISHGPRYISWGSVIPRGSATRPKETVYTN